MGFWCKAAEGYWGFFLRADGASSLPAFDRRVPLRFAEGVEERWGFPGVELSQTQPVGKSPESRFKAVSTAGVSSFGCCGCREGIYGRCWGLSEAFQGGSGGRSSPAVLGGGLWMAGTLFSMEPRDRGKRRSYKWSCCPEPGSESRFRIRPEPGAAAWWGDPPGSLTIRVVHSLSGSWALGFQPRNRRRPEEKYSKYTRGIIEKKFYFFQKGYSDTQITALSVPVLIISYL